MTAPTRYTPHGVPIPANLNSTGRPVPQVDHTTPAARRFLDPVGLTGRLRLAAHQAAGDPDPRSAQALVAFAADLRQFRRAEENARALPGEYLGTDKYPTQPLPFASREEHRPDRLPGTEAHKVMAAAVSRIDTDAMTEQLCAQMDARDPPSVRAERAAADNAPPSLRESISAAASLDYGRGGE